MHSRLPLALAPFALFLTAAAPLPIPQHGMSEWKAQAARVSITRDDLGIAHVHGKTDPDAVFGMIYAQAEDDFPRIEANYLTALGRTAEADGEKAIWQDLRARLYVSEAELKADYWRSPQSMRRLMDAWADGLNYYLATHPNVRPRVLTRFEPWMALSFTEGSIGGNIEQIDLRKLEKFYSGREPPQPRPEFREPGGSNGIALAPALTAGGKSLLLINPHTSFYFRSELQMQSDDGLDAYGAVTWGQFFIYQGFNRHAGWMHTTSGVDVVDEFAERVEGKSENRCYRYGSACRPLGMRPITIRIRTPKGVVPRTFTTYRTHHGPVVRADKGRWISFSMMNKPVEALQQSFLRTKSRDLPTFLQVAQLRANSSNNTIFADDKGEIAFLHPQFVPRRNDRFDYTRPVDGSDPATDWQPLHAISELPNTINPPSGWVHNSNNWPYRATGPLRADHASFPRYMDTFGENYRGIHARQLLTGSRGWTLDKLQAAAFDSYQPGFAELIPTLLRAWDALPLSDRQGLAEPIAVLRNWNYRWSTDSVAQSLATFWVEALMKKLNAPRSEEINVTTLRLGRDTTGAQKIAALRETVDRLKGDFGRWQVPWGEINRFQRISPAIDHPFSDVAPSIPVPFTSGRWGSLASFGAAQKPGTKRWYGTSGNSFVAVVEFGPRVRAHAVTAGGESGNPASPHFNDQAKRYASGNLRDVYFYPDQLKGHIERTYRPGE